MTNVELMMKAIDGINDDLIEECVFVKSFDRAVVKYNFVKRLIAAWVSVAVIVTGVVVGGALLDIRKEKPVQQSFNVGNITDDDVIWSKEECLIVSSVQGNNGNIFISESLQNAMRKYYVSKNLYAVHVFGEGEVNLAEAFNEMFGDSENDLSFFMRTGIVFLTKGQIEKLCYSRHGFIFLTLAAKPE